MNSDIVELGPVVAKLQSRLGEAMTYISMLETQVENLRSELAKQSEPQELDSQIS